AVQTLCNFFIPSGSGQAYVTMPIMAPLAEQLGIEKQVAVLAYQFGDGFTNVVTPTNAAFMGMLAIARVPYQRWLRFALPLMLKLYGVAAVAVVVAIWIGYR
ncbi:MAG: TIGR00366 family protein, partial [Planctomycetes bacterium]|nr:TIGR00366 family protein [Planctomycetota bacterium]